MLLNFAVWNITWWKPCWMLVCLSKKWEEDSWNPWSNRQSWMWTISWLPRIRWNVEPFSCNNSKNSCKSSLFLTSNFLSISLYRWNTWLLIQHNPMYAYKTNEATLIPVRFTPSKCAQDCSHWWWHQWWLRRSYIVSSGIHKKAKG